MLQNCISCLVNQKLGNCLVYLFLRPALQVVIECNEVITESNKLMQNNTRRLPGTNKFKLVIK